MIETPFAPAVRRDPEDPSRRRAGLLGDSVGQAMLEAMPGPAMVLNAERQILCVNSKLLGMLTIDDATRLVGRRPGEAIHCLHAPSAPGGCGTGPACRHCGAVGAIRQALASRGQATEECRITATAEDGGRVHLDLRLHATHLGIEGEDLVIVGLEDIGHEKRRQVLERAFFHDLLNTCGGLQGMAELLGELADDPETEAAYKREIVQLSRLVVEEIRAHQQMQAAERGELQPAFDEVDVPAFLQELVALYRNHVVGGSRRLHLAAAPAVGLRTDASLLRRILGNLIKNALEATADGATITVEARVEHDGVVFAVHNPGVIAPEVQLQIFQRSFSTKGGAGRGIGTYAARLFVEEHLGGRVSFTSDERTGTLFTVRLPRG